MSPDTISPAEFTIKGWGITIVQKNFRYALTNQDLSFEKLLCNHN